MSDPTSRHSKFEVYICADEWVCPIHDDCVECYVSNCEEYEGGLEADWKLLESKEV